MLKKLFRYDMLSIRRILLPMLCAAPALGAVGLGLMELVMVVSQNESLALLQAGLIILYAMCLLCLACVGAVVLFFVVQRFYKNFFTDEGYLTFALPATAHEQLLSKIFSGVIWTFLSALTVLVGFALAVGVPIFQSLIGEEYISMIFGQMFAEFSWYLLIPYGIMLLVQAVAEIILLYTAITLGSLFMRKHKILGSVIFYFVVNSIVGIVNSIFSTLISVLFLTEITSTMVIATITSSLAVLLYSGMAAVGYFIMHRMLERKLNLE